MLKKIWSNLVVYFKNRPLIVMVALTVGILVLYRIGSLITLPTVNLNTDKVNDDNTFRDMLNLLGGGGLKRVSLFAIGISPYITSQIIVQLLSSDLIPPLARIAKSGEKGRKKIDQISRLLAFPFAILQGFAVIQLLQSLKMISFDSLTPLDWAYMLGTMVGGSYIAIFLGDLITKYGIGNGMTLIIASGIIANISNDFTNAYNAQAFVSSNLSLHVLYFVLYIFLVIIVVTLIVFVNGSIRKIPIQRTGQSLATKFDQLPYLPIKVNSSGVIPVIFSMALISIPLTVAQILKNDSPKWIIEDYFSFKSWTGIAIYFVLTFAFSFLYSFVQINPDNLAENLQKSGSFIPGIRPGPQTVSHISRVLYRLNWIGGLYIAVIASLPYIVDKYLGISSSFSLGGTGMIIIVTACIETFKAVKSANTATIYTTLKKELQTSDNNVSLW